MTSPPQTAEPLKLLYSMDEAAAALVIDRLLDQ